METQSAARAPTREIALYFRVRASKVESYGRVQRHGTVNPDAGSRILLFR
jgi:hypothetical protein